MLKRYTPFMTFFFQIFSLTVRTAKRICMAKKSSNLAYSLILELMLFVMGVGSKGFNLLKIMLPIKAIVVAVLLFFVTSNAFAQTRVQYTTGSCNGSASIAMTALTSTPVNGNTLVAIISTRGTSASRVNNITQTGATWSRAIQATNTNGTTTEIWYAPNVSSAVKAITINLAASLRAAAVVIEYSGILTTSPLDAFNNSTGNSTAAVTGTTVTTAQRNELWIGGIGLVNSTYTLGTITNSFTSVIAAGVASTGTANQNSKVYALEKIVTATGTASSGGAVSTSSQWSGAIATFKKAPIVSTGTGGNWSSTGTWVGGVVPNTGDDVIIAGGATVTVDVSTAVIDDLTVNGTLDVNTYTLTGTGTLSAASNSNILVGGTSNFPSGFATTTLNSGSTVNYDGAGAQTVNDIAYGGNLVISGSGTKTWTEGAARTVTGNLTIKDGAKLSVTGAYAWTVTGTTTIGEGTNGALATLEIANATGTKTFTDAVTINNDGYFSETSAAALAFGNDVTINTTGTTVGGSTLTENGAATVGIAGNFTDNGSYTASTGIHTFSGSGKTISGSSSISIPTSTFTGSYTNSGTFNSTALLTITGVTLTNSGTFSITGTLQGTGTFANSSTGTLTSNAYTTIATITNQGTTTFNGSQNLTPTTFTNSGLITINGSIYTNPGTFTNSGTINYASSGNINTATASFTNTGIINLSGTGNIAGITNNTNGVVNLYSLASSGATIGTFNNATSSSFLYISALTPNATFISTLTATVTGNTVYYNGTGAQTIKNTTYSNLSLSGSGTKTLAGPATVSGTLTLTTGILATTSSNLLSVTNTSPSAISGGSTASFINGPVNWTLPASLASGSTYNFPVGNTTYLPFSLVNPITGGTGPVIQVQANNTDVSASAAFDAVTMSSISHSEYWALNVVSGNFTSSSASVARQSAISPLDAIAGSTASTGSYSYLGGNAGTTGVSNSNNIGSNQYFVLAATRPATISTSTLSASSFCQGASVSVPYTITGIFNSGNNFTAQRSDATGSFSSPVTIGTLTSTTTAGTIPATIPAGTVVGSGYRIRVISSNPAKTGTDNGSNLTVVAPPGAPTTTGANICIGAPNGTTLSATGAGATDKYNWYDAASAGNLLKTSTDNTDNIYTTPTLAATTSYWVSIQNSGGCEGARTQVTATYPTTSTDNQSAAGTDSWIGHVYEGTNSGIAYNGAFTNYYGNYTKTETFDESFGGDATCFNITSNSITQSIYTETFSVRYRMNSTKKGLYVVNMGSDDGNRLTVDGNKIYDDWSDHGVNDHTNVLINLTGSSSLVYDFYENGGGNRVYFNTLTQVLANNLNANTSQSIYIGNSGTAISGDTYGTLPTNVTLSGTGYQWTYSTTPTGTKTTISGATGATYTPSTTAAPFNAAGTYYVFRNAILSSTNNVSPSTYVATNESNMATLVISPMPTITTSVSPLSGFICPVNNGPSAAQTFYVSGSGLLTNIDVSLPINSNYELSTDGITYAASVIVMINAGGVANAPNTPNVYVRLKAGLAVNSYTDVITASSIDAGSKTITLLGSVTVQPTITVTPNTMTGLSYVLGFGPSTGQSFTVTGFNLQTNITVTAPTDFEIATTQGGTYSSSLTLTQSSGNVNAPVWVRLKTGLSTSTYNENITLTATYADNKTVNCQGVVNRATINISKFTLAGFIYTLNSGPSGAQTFTVSGSSLSADIAIAATTNFEISSNGSTWTSGSLTLPQSGGVVNTTPIYVRMKVGHAVGVISPENIFITTTNAITQLVACSGAVTGGTATISSNSILNGFFYILNQGPSVTQSFTVSGTTLTGNLTVTAPTDFEISSSGTEGTFTNTFSITPASGKVNASLVYIRLKAGLTLSPGIWNESVILSSSGATDVSVACNGKVVAQPTIVAGPTKPYNVCSGSTATLTSSGTNISSQSWAGPNNFTSTNQNPALGTVTATNSGDYTVTGNVASGINLLTNGDFESGNTGFGTTYTYNASSGTYGSYWIYNNPNTANSTYFINGTDHTPSGTLMMIVDGSETSGAIVWSETVSVNSNTNYQFSYWAENVNSQGNTNYAHLQLYVNNVPVGPVNTASLTSWVQYLCNINSGSSTSLQLTIINTSVGGSGNDFGLDDIVLEQVFQVNDVVTLNVNPMLTPAVSIVASANPTTTGATVTFTATPTNGGATPTYAWYVGSTLQNGVTGSTFSYVPTNGDQVKCVMTTSISCYTNLTATSTAITMVVNTPVNLWIGSTNPTTGTDWGTATNWTVGVPAAGADVTFATVSNHGSNAVNDLVLDMDRTQGSLINQTTKNLIIPAGKRLTINNTITTDNNVNRIYVVSSSTNPNGSLIFYSNNPVYGTVEMYSMAYKGSSITVPNPYPPYGTITTTYRWQYFGIPISTLITSPTLDQSYVRKWDESGTTVSNHWVNVDNYFVLQPGIGYELTQDAPKTFYFQGQLVNWDVTSLLLAKTATALFPGQHVLANPFTSAIDIKKIVFGSDMQQAVWLYSTGSFGDWYNGTQGTATPGQYVVSTPGTAGNTGVESQVPSMQAMLVQVSNATSNAFVTIPYSAAVKNTAMQRVKGTSNSATSDMIGLKIDVKSLNYSDKMWLFSKNSFTKNFDNGYDGLKILGSALTPQIYAIESDGNYQIDCINDLDNTNLGFKAGQDTEYTMTFTHQNLSSKYSGIYLVDLVEKKTIDITGDSTTYVFNATSTDKTVQRFRIVTRIYEKNSPDAEANIKVFGGNGIIIAQNLSNLTGDLIVFDISGRALKTVQLVPNGLTTITGLIPGAYIAKATTSLEKISKRLIVR